MRWVVDHPGTKVPWSNIFGRSVCKAKDEVVVAGIRLINPCPHGAPDASSSLCVGYVLTALLVTIAGPKDRGFPNTQLEAGCFHSGCLGLYSTLGESTCSEGGQPREPCNRALSPRIASCKNYSSADDCRAGFRP